MAKHASKEVRHAQILEAASKCIGDRGFERTTMDDIVRQSGLSKGSLYWHFKNKEAILVALFDSYAGRLLHSWDQASPGDVRAFAYEQGCLVLRTLTAERWLAESWLEFLHHPSARLRMSTLYEQYRERIAALVVARSSESAQLAALVVAMIEGLLLQTIVEPEFDPIPAWELGVARLFDG